MKLLKILLFVPLISFLLCNYKADAARIVSLAPNVTEILFKLGLGEDIVGVDDYSNFPEQVKAIEKLGAFNSPDIERILLLKPDYIFTSASFDSDKSDFFISQGVKVIRISPRSLRELKEDIKRLGEILGRGEEARLVLEDINRRLKKVSKNIRSIRPKVFIALSGNPLITVSSFTGDLIELAGGKNIAGDITEDRGIFNIEALVDRNPDIIIESGFIKDMYLPGIINAVKNKRIYRDLPADILLRPGPRAIDAVELLNRIFYENKSQ